MTSEQYARYQALMEALRKRRHTGQQVELLLAGLEQLALAGNEGRQVPSSGSDHGHEFTRVNSRSFYQVVVQQCPDCGSGRVATNRGDRKLAPQELRAILCDAHRRAPGKKNRASVPDRLRRTVLQRDRFRCRSAGCGGTSFLAVHHLVPRNTPENLITLCSPCHRALHARE
jgi:5-methylcytosine-specific restriction endonuclease McrA